MQPISCQARGAAQVAESPACDSMQRAAEDPAQAAIYPDVLEPRTVLVTPWCPGPMRRQGPWRVEDFELHRQVYKGKASLLYRATCRMSGQPVALKLYRKARLSTLNWFQVRLHACPSSCCMQD